MNRSLLFLCAPPGPIRDGSEHANHLEASCRAIRELGQPRSVLVAEPSVQPAATLAAAALKVAKVAPVSCDRLRDPLAAAAAVRVAEEPSWLINTLLATEGSCAVGGVVVATRDEVLEIGRTFLAITGQDPDLEIEEYIVNGQALAASITLKAAKVDVKRYRIAERRWDKLFKFVLRRDIRVAQFAA